MMTFLTLALVFVATIVGDYTTNGRTMTIKLTCPVNQEHQFFGKRCCGLELFNYNSLIKFMDPCNVPPTTETLSLAENYWKMFQCLMTKFMEGKPFNLHNFGEIMTANLSNPTKSAILASLDALPDVAGLEIKEGGTEAENLNTIQLMWSHYFDSEHKICSEKFPEADAQLNESLVKLNVTTHNLKNMSYTWRQREYWAPAYKCGNSKYPDLLLTWETTPEYLTGLNNCMKSLKDEMNAKCGPQNMTRNLHKCVVDSCVYIMGGMTTQEEIFSKMNFEAKMVEIIPKFLTQSNKNKITEKYPQVYQYFREIKDGGQDSTQTMPQIFDKLKNKVDAFYSNLAPELVGVCGNSLMFKYLNNAIGLSEQLICDASTA